MCVCVGGGWEKGVRGVSESMGVCSILKFIYKSVIDKMDVNFHNYAKWKINMYNNILFKFPSSKDQCIVFKMLGISEVLKLQLLDNKNIIFGYPAVEWEMQM